MEELLKITSVFVVAVFKFWLSFPAAKLAGFTFLQALVVTALGGLSGFFLFYFFSQPVFYFFNWLGKKIKKLFPFNPFLVSNSRSNRVFSTRSRWIGKIFSRFGIWGLAFLTPSLISIPVGSTIAANLSGRHTKNKIKVFIAFTASIILWSVVFNSLVYFLF